jgi:prepilin-type N-terminal cleavage/methylation domain-containing protein
MKASNKRSKKGFTLIELTVAMLIGTVIAAVLMAMLNQQIAFLRIFRAQSFLNEEAPIVSHHVSKLLLNAERFRLHASLDDAKNGINPRLTDSPVVVLNFRQPDGTLRAGILSFEGNTLNYYLVGLDGSLSVPEWAITNKPTDVSFFVESGIIRTRLTGPAGEQITFSRAM